MARWWMPLFDELPRGLRDLLNTAPLAPHPDDIQGLHVLYFRRGVSEEDLIDKVRRALDRKPPQ
jgi:hypothetical protein